MSEHLTKELSENLSCDVLSKYIKSDLDYYWIYGNRYIYLYLDFHLGVFRKSVSNGIKRQLVD